ncbi:RNA polymerase subunit sigma-24 [Actinacidiphila cocklensis]|uniref:RNA polymerase subunit sigma-24 n=2 Tax=Actinacidiphila cocklensis TaxID=887465 RepID=A0A9W4DVP8_9ACTN|nr:RNA polymerase subunit sigma-24 [Actinacidiphila cocklensis]
MAEPDPPADHPPADDEYAAGESAAADRRATARLVRAAQRGDTLAMNDLLDELAPFVGRICAPIALDDGPDAAQEALMIVFRGLRGLKEPAAVYGWVRTVAAREAVRVAKRAARAVPAELAELPAPGDPQLGADIRDVLTRLSPEHRAVLVLRDLEGLDERTAAERLGLRVGTVKSRLHRARDTFRKAWSA